MDVPSDARVRSLALSLSLYVVSTSLSLPVQVCRQTGWRVSEFAVLTGTCLTNLQMSVGLTRQCHQNPGNVVNQTTHAVYICPIPEENMDNYMGNQWAGTLETVGPLL
jgi:hypothetical protein